MGGSASTHAVADKKPVLGRTDSHSQTALSQQQHQQQQPASTSHRAGSTSQSQQASTPRSASIGTGFLPSIHTHAASSDSPRSRGGLSSSGGGRDQTRPVSASRQQVQQQVNGSKEWTMRGLLSSLMDKPHSIESPRTQQLRRDSPKSQTKSGAAISIVPTHAGSTNKTPSPPDTSPNGGTRVLMEVDFLSGGSTAVSTFASLQPQPPPSRDGARPTSARQRKALAIHTQGMGDTVAAFTTVSTPTPPAVQLLKQSVPSQPQQLSPGQPTHSLLPHPPVVPSQLMTSSRPASSDVQSMVVDLDAPTQRADSRLSHSDVASPQTLSPTASAGPMYIPSSSSHAPSFSSSTSASLPQLTESALAAHPLFAPFGKQQTIAMQVEEDMEYIMDRPIPTVSLELDEAKRGFGRDGGMLRHALGQMGAMSPERRASKSLSQVGHGGSFLSSPFSTSSPQNESIDQLRAIMGLDTLSGSCSPVYGAASAMSGSVSASSTNLTLSPHERAISGGASGAGGTHAHSLSHQQFPTSSVGAGFSSAVYAHQQQHAGSPLQHFLPASGASSPIPTGGGLGGVSSQVSAQRRAVSPSRAISPSAHHRAISPSARQRAISPSVLSRATSPAAALDAFVATVPIEVALPIVQAAMYDESTEEVQEYQKKFQAEKEYQAREALRASNIERMVAQGLIKRNHVRRVSRSMFESPYGSHAGSPTVGSPAYAGSPFAYSPHQSTSPVPILGLPAAGGGSGYISPAGLRSLSPMGTPHSPTIFATLVDSNSRAASRNMSPSPSSPHLARDIVATMINGATTTTGGMSPPRPRHGHHTSIQAHDFGSASAFAMAAAAASSSTSNSQGGGGGDAGGDHSSTTHSGQSSPGVGGGANLDTYDKLRLGWIPSDLALTGAIPVPYK